MAEQLKNLYSEVYIEKLALEIKKSYKNFESKMFISSIFNTSWQDLELKARMRHIAITLNKYLPFLYARILPAEISSIKAILLSLPIRPNSNLIS